MIRLFGLDNLGQMTSSVYCLAEELFQYPKEANRFWQRWTEGAGTDVNFTWGCLFVAARDSFPLGFERLVGFATGLLKGLPVESPAAAYLSRMLWNLNCLTEEVAVEALRGISVVKTEREGHSTVRTDAERFHNGVGEWRNFSPLFIIGLTIIRLIG